MTDVRPRSWRREILLMAVLYLVYTSSRLIPLAPAGAQVRNGHRVLNFERALHLDPEHALNNWLYDAPRWLSIAASYFYQSMHYVLTVATLIWLYRSSAAAYRRARTWLAAMTFPALLVFWLFPVAPPRTLPGGVLHDTIAEQHHYGWWGAGGGPAPTGLASLVNDNAAMPSLHVAWAVWVGWNLVHSARHRVVRAVGYVYPLITATVVISTGNHYLLDVLAGALLAFTAKAVVDRMVPKVGRTQAPAPAQSGTPCQSVAPSASPGVDPPRHDRRPPLRTHPHGHRRPAGTLARHAVRRAAAVAAAAAVVGLDAHVLIPYVSRAAGALSHPAHTWLALALAAEIVSLVASAQLQRGMLATAGTRLRMPTAVGMTYAAYAMNQSLPAGPALSAGYTFRRLRQLGASTPTAGFTVLSSSVISLLAYGLLAVAGLTVAGGASGDPFAAVVGLVVAALLMLLTRSLLARPHRVERIGLGALYAINRLLRRPPEAGAPKLRRSTGVLASIRPRCRDWALGLGAALLSWVSDFACLYASCRAIGVNDASIGVILLAYLSGMSLSGVSLVPAGLGVVDAAVILVLVRNGVGAGPAAAAMVLYRVFAFGFGVVAGWIAWLVHAHARASTMSTAATRRKHDHVEDHDTVPGAEPHAQSVRVPRRARPDGAGGRRAPGVLRSGRPAARPHRRAARVTDTHDGAQRRPDRDGARRSG